VLSERQTNSFWHELVKRCRPLRLRYLMKNATRVFVAGLAVLSLIVSGSFSLGVILFFAFLGKGLDVLFRDEAKRRHEALLELCNSRIGQG